MVRSGDEPPTRWVAGADAVRAWRRRRELLAQVGAHRELSSSLAREDASVNV